MIDKELEAKILRYHFVEQWRVNTIARQLGIHHSTVDRVLSQAGLPKAERARRPSIVDPYHPLIIETLAQYPTLSAAGRCETPRSLRTPISSRRSAPTWMRKGLSPKPPGGRRAGRHLSGGCSTDSDHLMSTTLVRDASGAATVAAGLGPGKC